MSFHSRQLRREELSTLAGWMVEESWHISLNILESCYDLDPNGWIAAETADGQLIGSITGCILDDNTVFGGFFIVRKDWRRKGVGKMLFEIRLKYVGDRNFGIDAEEKRVQFDKQHGFVHSSFPITAYLGTVDKSKLCKTDLGGVVISELRDDLFQKLSMYDSKLHTIPRVKFLKQWTEPTITNTYIAMDSTGSINGYGCIQPIEGGHYHIGPVFAENDVIAKALFNKLILSVPEGKQVGFEIPSENKIAMELAKVHNLKFELNFIRMYTKYNMNFDMEKIYAFTTMGIALI